MRGNYGKSRFYFGDSNIGHRAIVLYSDVLYCRNKMLMFDNYGVRLRDQINKSYNHRARKLNRFNDYHRS